jgi:hypothetical protein
VAAPYVPTVGVVIGAGRFVGDGRWHRFGR